VFGKIGNMFKEDQYLCLPDVVPTASIHLAMELLRLHGVEPRLQILSMTIKQIVNEMKKFLCVFAWNIESPDLVTSESLNQILQVLREAIDEGGSSSKGSRVKSIADMEAGQSQVAAPCASVLDTPAAADGAAISMSALSLERGVEILREVLGIETTSMIKVIPEALRKLDDPGVTATCNGIKSLPAKVHYLVNDVLSITE
jgi:hypothetical protein